MSISAQQLLFSRWLHSSLGKMILHEEQAQLRPIWQKFLGDELVMVGDPAQASLLKYHRLKHHTVICAAYPARHGEHILQADYNHLPLMPSSIETVLIPHSLEFTLYPDRLLQQVEISLRPEGQLIIIGFNPVSLWGLRYCFSWHRKAPWNGNFRSRKALKMSLTNLNFVIEHEESFCYKSPFNKHYLSWLEIIGRKWFTQYGGLYLLVARKKVGCITPSKLKWQETALLSKMGLSEPAITPREANE